MIGTSEALFLFFFLGLFNLIGGAVLGFGLRPLVRRQPQLVSVFFLVWGSGFGGIPLFMGAVFFLSSGLPAYWVGQLLLFFGTAAAIAFASDELIAGLLKPGMIMALIGGGMMLVGAFLVTTNIWSGFSIEQLLGAGLLILGALLLGWGIIHALRSVS
jgi:hypothetical protein